MLPVTTLGGKQRQRMKWSDTINRHLMLCYYKVTKIETDKTDYRSQLHTAFTNTYPELNFITEQRLADQVRTIIKNNRIPQQELENIKQQAQPAANDTQTTQEETEANGNNTDETTRLKEKEQTTQTQTHEPERAEQQHNTTKPHTQTQNITDIQEKFELTHIKYANTYADTRPHIKKPPNNPNINATISHINTIIQNKIDNSTTMEELQTLIYTGALTTIQIHTKPEKTEPSSGKKKHITPAWQHRLQQRIEKLRKDIGQLTQCIQGKLSNRKKKQIGQMTKEETIEQLDNKKQKLQALAKRLRRYKKSEKRRKQNHMFNTNQKKFYQTLDNTGTSIDNPPNKEDIELYWSNIWSNPIQHNQHAHWIQTEINKYNTIQQMPETIITHTEVTKAITNTHNWKAPGKDKITNYWLKKFTATHAHLAKLFNSYITNPHTIPPTLTQGITYLKPKEEKNTANPAKYRPITCLPTIYKILTSIIAQKLDTHVTHNNIVNEEQKGCRKGSQGCKEQLIIDTEITNQVKTKHRSLHYAYIDYQKAFDSIPHSWLITILHIYKIDPKLIQFLENTMKNWNTTLSIQTNKGNITSKPIQIKRGIFQGDSLSALWFCLALNPLSNILNNTKYGYTITGTNPHKITHLLYMDDLKLIAATNHQLNYLLKTTETFSTDINMTLGTDKCKKNSIIKGKQAKQEDYMLNNNEDYIEAMEQTDSYKYLGYKQKTGIEDTKIKEELKEKYKNRLIKILKTELTARNKTIAINTYAIPILTYSFGIIKWSETDLEALNTLTRSQCNKYRIHHIHTATERFTLDRKEGGRGHIDIRNLNYKQIDNLRKYFIERAETSTLHKAIIYANTSTTPLQFHNKTYDPMSNITTADTKKHNWKQKTLHGKHPQHLSQPHIDQQASNAWLTRGNIYSETEGFMIAIQDQVINTKYYSKHIIKDPNTATDKCRLCKQQIETIDHIIGGCTTLANTEYTRRHDNVAKIIHQQIAIQHNLTKQHIPTYKYKPQNILENEDHKLYWNRSITTDKTTPHNKPDITLIHKQKKITQLIEISIPNTANIQKKTGEKIEKYIPLAEEIKDMWHQNKVEIVPVILSTTGVIPHNIHKSISTLQLHPNIYKQIQKSVIIDTCSLTRKVLNAT